MYKAAKQSEFFFVNKSKLIKNKPWFDDDCKKSKYNLKITLNYCKLMDNVKTTKQLDLTIEHMNSLKIYQKMLLAI